jgi:ribosomal-protein-alanine acetyltransferase
VDIRLETANLQFLDELYRIEEECFDEEAFTKRQLAYLLTAHNAITLAAKDDRNIVGFIIVQVEITDVKFGHIITLSVVQSYRCKKIATCMIKEIERLLKQRGIVECRLEVREDNYVAISLYKKLGYQRIGKLERYYGSKHGLYFKKLL